MDHSHAFLPSRQALLFIAAGFAGLLATVILNKLAFPDRGLLQEGVPLFSIAYLLRSLLIALSTLAICHSIVVRHPHRREPRNLDFSFGTLERWSIAIALAFSALFLLIFLVRPDAFSYMSLEDGWVEWASAILLFAACAVFLLTFLKSKERALSGRLVRITGVAFAIVFFVMAMEEVSWMQRVIGFETGDKFAGNIQGEANLHNFASDLIELVYYFYAFVFTVFLPFMRWQGAIPLDCRYLDIFAPRPFIIYIGALTCAYNFDMWNIFLIQASFYASCFILIYVWISSAPKTSLLTGLVLSLVISSQLIYLYFGERYAREWEITEYREFLMPLAFLTYALDVRFRIGELGRAKGT